MSTLTTSQAIFLFNLFFQHQVLFESKLFLPLTSQNVLLGWFSSIIWLNFLKYHKKEVSDLTLK